MLKPLLFSFLFLLFLIPTVHALIYDDSYILADAYGQNNTPTVNRNTGALAIYNFSYATGAPSYYWSYIKINTTFIPANATIAYAEIYFWRSTTTENYNNHVSAYSTSLNWTETNLTWLNRTPLGTFQDNTTIPTAPGAWHKFIITNAVQTAVNAGKDTAIILQSMDNRTNVNFHSREAASPPYLNISFSSGPSGDCNNTLPLGSICDHSDLSGRGIITTVDYTCLNDKYYTCPEGTFCSQITPIFNISTDIVSPGSSNWCKGCFFINYLTGWPPHYAILATNCFDASFNIKTECNCYGVYCSDNVFNTSTSTGVNYTIPVYTAGCFNPSSGLFTTIINSTGGTTSIQNLTEEYCPNCDLTNTTATSCTSNSTTTCYDENCNIVKCAVRTPTTCQDNALGQLALVIGSGFGLSDCSSCQAVFSILASLSFGIMLLYFSRKSKMGVQAFIFGALGMLVMFTVIGWFYSWLMILLMVLSAFLMAKQLGFGGGG